MWPPFSIVFVLTRLIVGLLHNSRLTYHAGRRVTLHTSGLTTALSWLQVVTKASRQSRWCLAPLPPPRAPSNRTTNSSHQACWSSALVWVDLLSLGLIVGSCLVPIKEMAEGKGCICSGCFGWGVFDLFGEIGATSVGTSCTQVWTS